LPKNITPPSISGLPEVGQTLACNSGQWSANAKSVEVLWADSNNEIVVRGSTLEVSKELASSNLQCVVIAMSAAGSVIETKTIGISDSKPAALSNPVISGSARVGSVVTCSPGSWNKFTTSLGVEWIVGSRSVSSSTSLTIPEDAAGQNVTCRVVGIGIVGTASTSVSIQIPAKPLIQGTLVITGLPTSGYAAGNGLVIQCTGASATGAVESFEITWYLRDSSTGTPVTRVATGAQYALPNGFFEQHKGRVVICGYSAIGPGGASSVFDVKSIVTPRTPDAPSVQVTGFPSYGSNGNAWLNLPITCKVDSYFDNSVSRSVTVQWRIYDSSAPYYPLSTTPSTPIGSGTTLVLTKAILDQAVLKSIGCAATVTTATGSATAYSTKTYVDFSNISAADTTPPTYRVVSSPSPSELRLGQGGYFYVEISDTDGVGMYPINGIKLISPSNTEVPSSGGFLPVRESGNNKVGVYPVRVSIPTKASGAIAGEYKLVLSIFDSKSNWTGWVVVSTFIVTE
jgi:hypothetical protein